jgi:hypothetical protein
MSAGLLVTALGLAASQFGRAPGPGPTPGDPASLVPPLVLSLPPPAAHLDLSPPPPPDFKSGWEALGLTVACELPTAFFGPSCGHLYAGEEAHFFMTGGLRLADLLALVALDRLAFGTPPLYAVIQPRFSRNDAAWPLAYPLDFLLVALWWGTGLYDLIDSYFAAERHNRRGQVQRFAPLSPTDPPLALLRF